MKSVLSTFFQFFLHYSICRIFQIKLNKAGQLLVGYYILLRLPGLAAHLMTTGHTVLVAIALCLDDN